MLRASFKSLGVLLGVLILVMGTLGVPLFAQETIKIGFFAPITGPVAADGASSKQSVELAVKEINDRGGIAGKKIDLIVYDDRFDPKEAVSIAQKLIGLDKVVAVVSGSYSGPTRAVAPIYQEAKIPMVAAYAVHPDITKAGEYIFRQSFIGTVQGAGGGEVAAKLMRAKTASILTMDNDFGRTLAGAFKNQAEKRGVKILSIDTFPMGEKEFSPLLTKIKGLNPDVIYNTGYPSEGSLIVKQAKALGIKSKILATEGIDSTTQFFGIAGDAAEGVVITTNLNRDDKRPVVQNFIKNYKARYGPAPDMVGASSYDALRVLANAIQIGGTKPDAIREALAKTKDFDGVTGIIKGYTKGEVLKPVQVQIVRGGEFHYFGEITDPEIITPPR